MFRRLKAAVAQLGPIHLADSRSAVIKRLMAMMREAHAAGARFVVFPELALTTFFPRYWMTDQSEIDRFFEREMPGPETRPLFYLARDLGVATRGHVAVEREHLHHARQRAGGGFGVDGEAVDAGHADTRDGSGANGRARPGLSARPGG